MFRSIDWDKVRLLTLAILALIALREWLKNSLGRRGKHQTLYSLARVCASAVGGASLSLLAYALAEWRPQNLYCFMPMMPGFFFGAITVGVHRDDNLLRNVILLLNSVMYGSIVFACYRLFIPRRKEQGFS